MGRRVGPHVLDNRWPDLGMVAQPVQVAEEVPDLLVHEVNGLELIVGMGLEASQEGA
ncbi:MAG: hypothetical protein M3O70_02490 [Actinomycetota bacterium]|nr:hypothetical protein [Actinomycetota bacterium]